MAQPPLFHGSLEVNLSHLLLFYVRGDPPMIVPNLEDEIFVRVVNLLSLA
jgi:hypothetical protein